jgi:hypothetical protein
MAKFIVVHSVKVAMEFVPETFGRLTTLGPIFWLSSSGKRKYIYQVCSCVCGSCLVVARSNLLRQNTKSCGCLHKDTMTKHGRCDKDEYHIWKSMPQRCYNPKSKYYRHYGGRGIRVCDRWLDPENGFVNFFSDMGERPSKTHSLDRIDNNGNYCPENCKWATKHEQARNRRNNHLVTHNNKTQCLTDWAKELGVSFSTLRHRIQHQDMQSAMTPKI